MQLLRNCRGKKWFGTGPTICSMWSLFEGWENMSFRSRGLFQRKRVRTNGRLWRSTLPASFPHPPPSPFLPFSIHILTSEHDLPPATSGDAFQHEKLQLLLLLSAERLWRFFFSFASGLSVRGDFGSLLIVSRDPWSQVGVFSLLLSGFFFVFFFTSPFGKQEPVLGSFIHSAAV